MMYPGQFMGAQGPVANPFNQNMQMKLQGLGTGYGNGQDIFDAYGDAAARAMKLQPFGNQTSPIGAPLSNPALNVLSQYVGGGQQQMQPGPIQQGNNRPGMSMLQKWGMISPLLSMMGKGGGDMMMPLLGLGAFGLAKHFGAFK